MSDKFGKIRYHSLFCLEPGHHQSLAMPLLLSVVAAAYKMKSLAWLILVLAFTIVVIYTQSDFEGDN